ncbi:hypothetical protein BC834DRAFT_890984 [Gloeopeniophorella convolvens]|nr:hypothetical protein BC834DRAFT_890984 [Gloeopeniophorella convolvens]
MSKEITIQVAGKFIWELVFDYDNSGNSGEIEHKYSVTIAESYNSSDFLKTISQTTQKLTQSHEVSAEAGVSYGPASASLKYSYNNTKEVSDMLERTTSRQVDQKFDRTSTETRTYKVGAKSRLALYQRSFVAPGMRVQKETYRTTSKPLIGSELVEEVPLEFTLRPVRWLVGLDVVYTSNTSSAPSDRVRELYGGAEDINKGFGGDYVWLVPIWSTETSKAISSFDLVIQGESDGNYKDLARGSKGEWRYLIPVRSQDTNSYIIDVRLIRRDSGASSPPSDSGYTGQTGDINRDRKGDWLYLVWKTAPAYPV